MPYIPQLIEDGSAEDVNALPIRVETDKGILLLYIGTLPAIRVNKKQLLQAIFAKTNCDLYCVTHGRSLNLLDGLARAS